MTQQIYEVRASGLLVWDVEKETDKTYLLKAKIAGRPCTYRVLKKDVKDTDYMHILCIKPLFTFDIAVALKALTAQKNQVQKDYELQMRSLAKGISRLVAK